MIRARSFSPQGASPPVRQGFSAARRQGRAQAGDDFGRQRREPGAAGERVEQHAAVLDLHDRAGRAVALEAQHRAAGPTTRPSARRAARCGRPRLPSAAPPPAPAPARRAARRRPRRSRRSPAGATSASPRSPRRRARAPSAARTRRRQRLAGALPTRRRSAPRSGRRCSLRCCRAPRRRARRPARCAQRGRRRGRSGLGRGAFLLAGLRLLRQGEGLGAALRRRGLRHGRRRAAAAVRRGRGAAAGRGACIGRRPAAAPGMASAPRPRVERRPRCGGAAAPVAGAIVVEGGGALSSLSSLRSAVASSDLATGFASACERARSSAVARAACCLACRFRRGGRLCGGAAAAPSSPAQVPCRAARSAPAIGLLAQAIRGRCGRAVRVRRRRCFSPAAGLGSCAGLGAVAARRRRRRQHRLVHRPIPPEHADQGRGHHAGEAGRDLRSRQPRPEREHAIEQRGRCRGRAARSPVRAAARASARIASRSDGGGAALASGAWRSASRSQASCSGPADGAGAPIAAVVAHRAPPGSSGSRYAPMQVRSLLIA